jgi:hypothetical protein
MPVLLKRFAKGYCDVAYVDGVILFAHTTGDGKVQVEQLSAKDLKSQASTAIMLPEAPMFLRFAAISKTRWCVVGKGQRTGHAYAWLSDARQQTGASHGGPLKDLGGTFGNYPIIVRPIFSSFEVNYQVAPARARSYLGIGQVADFPIKQTSQGFAGWDGLHPVLRDSEYSLLFKDRDGAPRRLGEVQRYSGSLIVGQWNETGKVGIAGDYLGDIFTVIPGDSFEPYVVPVGSGFAVASRTSQGATVALVTQPFPKHEPKAGTVPTPPPAPQPEPEPPSVSIPNGLNHVKAARAKYASKSGNERAFLICNYVAWQMRNDGAGCFYKSSGNHYRGASIDVLIFKPHGYTFDILGDAEGDARPQWSATQPTGRGDVKRWLAPVDPATFDPTPPLPEPPTPQPPTPEPEPPASINVKAELTEIRDRINVLLGAL